MRTLVTILFTYAIILPGCDLLEPANTPTTQQIEDIVSVGYIYHSANGNRLVSGSGDLVQTTPIDVPLPGKPVWLAAANIENQSVWATVLDNGVAKAFKVDSNGYTEIDIAPNQLNEAIPPTLVVDRDGKAKLANVFEQASSRSAAIMLDNTSGKRAYIADNGDLVIKEKDDEQRLAINALLHARLLVDEQQRILVLTDPDTSYGHIFVLGDTYPHAKSISLVETKPTLRVAHKITLDTVDVIEGNALIWQDLNGDQLREIITTVSNDVSGSQGGRIVIYDENGNEYGSSEAIGAHYRWRHQIAVAPFKSQDQLHLVSTYVPHIDPNIEFFRLDDKSMVRENLSSIYTSHLSTGPNIDISVAGDFDNDGKIEVLQIERYSRNEFGAFELSDNGPLLDWTIPLDGAISSNTAAVTLPNNTIALGIGLGQSLRIWHPMTL